MPSATSDHYFLTLNNYTEDDNITIRAWGLGDGARITNKTRITYVAGCEEVGEDTQRDHMHVYIQLSSNISPKKLGDWLAGQIEQEDISDEDDAPARKSWTVGSRKTDGTMDHFCRGTDQQCYDYVFKEETKKPGTEPFEFGERTERQGKARSNQGKRTDLDEVKQAIIDGKRNRLELATDYFDVYAKYPRLMSSYVNLIEQDKLRKQYAEDLTSATLREWQSTALAQAQAEVHPRQVHWWWQEAGNAGKSFFAEYVAATMQALVVSISKKADMLYIIKNWFEANPTSRIIMFDIPKTMAKDDCLHGIFDVVEQCKNGRITVAKYESSVVLIPKCHVFVLSNKAPPERMNAENPRWAADRYDVHEIVNIT